MNHWINRPKTIIPEQISFLPVYKHTLASGIPVWVIQASGEPITRVEIIFEAGSRYQQKTFQASFCNQMLTEGTRSHDSSELADLLDYHGSYISPQVDRDEAELTMACLDKHLLPTLDIFFEILAEPAFRPYEFRIQQSRRIHQMQIDQERVEALTRKAMLAALFGDQHPYGKTGGTDDVNALKPDDLAPFYTSRYRGKGAKMLICSTRPDEVLQAIEKRMEGLPLMNTIAPGEADLPLSGLEPSKQKLLLSKKKDAVQASIRVARPVINRSHPDFVNLSILSTIAGGFFGSRLMKKLREEKGYTYGIGGSIQAMKDHAYLVFSTTVGNEVYRDALADIRLELLKIHEQPVPDEELSLVKKYLAGDLQRRLDGALAQAELLRMLITHDQDFSDIERYANQLSSITSEQLMESAAQYFDPESFIEVVCKGS